MPGCRVTSAGSAASTCRSIQRHLNHWFSESVDLHGSEVSSNAATYFGNGLKGRAREDTFDEHRPLVVPGHGVRRRRLRHANGAPAQRDERGPRDRYIGDCEAGIARWNRILEKNGVGERLFAPSRRFNLGYRHLCRLSFRFQGSP